MKYHIPVTTATGKITVKEITQEEVIELEEQIFQLAKHFQQAIRPNVCIVVNKPHYLALVEYRKSLPGYLRIVHPQDLYICGFKILPGWCSKPVIVELP
jgi:hypothetical protein